MKKLILHICNWLGNIGLSYLGGRAIGTLFSKIFGGILTDEAFAEAHPKRYLLRVIAIWLLMIACVFALVSWPLTKFAEWIDSKIEGDSDDEEFED